MNSLAAWQAVYARYATDTGSGGLNASGTPLITGMFLELAPESQAFPYVVYGVQDEFEDDTQGSNFSVVLPVFNIYVSKDDVTTPLQSQVAAIARRIRLRYHRWIPTLSGYEFTAMQRVGGRMVPTEDEAWHWVEEYTLRVSESV